VIAAKSLPVVLCLACAIAITTLLPDRTIGYAQVAEAFPVTGLSMSYNGTRLAVIGRSMTNPATSQSTYYVDILDTFDFQPVSTIEVEDAWIRLVALNADGTRLAYNTVAGNVDVVDLTSGAYLVRGGNSVAETTDLVWNPAHDQFARVEPGLIWIANAETQVQTLHDAQGSGRFVAIAWSEDGHRLATSTYSRSTQETALQIWDLSAQDGFIDTPYLRRTDAGGTALAWNSDGTELASLERDGVHLYRAESGEEILHIPIEIEAAGLSLALHPEDTLVAVGSLQTIHVWSLPAGELVQTIEAQGPVDHLYWLDNHLIHGGSEGVYVDGELVYPDVRNAS
jgi:WD40 repeat protein